MHHSRMHSRSTRLRHTQPVAGGAGEEEELGGEMEKRARKAIYAKSRERRQAVLKQWSQSEGGIEPEAMAGPSPKLISLVIWTTSLV